MYYKVRITKGLPQAKTGGFTGNNLNKQVISFGGADMDAAAKPMRVSRYLKEVPRDEANLEAEKGETAFGDINGDGFTEHMHIGGKRHHSGGTPLNLPDGTFIFSDTAAMKIKDPEILAKFGKKKGSYTPAELAKPYDINKYRKILEDPNSDKVDKKSAELMIKNINLKLGALALAQEAKKGFPQGIPEVAQPYMQQMGIREEDILPQQPQQEAQVNQQAMQNPYENQGMGMQAPEENMMEMPPMAQYGMALGNNLILRNGGELDKYQSKGEVQSKKYTKKDLPEDAVIRDRLTVDVQAGDFIKQPDGTYLKVTKSKTGKTTSDSKSLGIPVEEFKKQSPENVKLIEDANAIIEKGIADETITVDKNNNIKITGNWGGNLKDRILLSRAINATNTKGIFGTDKYKIVSQSATGPYSKLNEKTGKLKGSGSFVAGFTPDLYEQRYIFEQAKGLGMTDDEAFAEVDRIQSDPKSKALIRRQFATTLGLQNIPEDDKALLSEDFYKKNYADITKGIESLNESEYRPAIGDDSLAGFEYYDALGYSPNFEYEIDPTVPAKDVEDAEDPNNPEAPDTIQNKDPEWWLQDRINMGMAARDLFNQKKYLPWAQNYSPEKLDPIFYDPTRELAAQSEQANLITQGLGQFTGPQAMSARASSIQGQSAKGAADTMDRYNKLNVGTANQFAGSNLEIANEAQRYNQAQNKQLYDQNVIANQAYQNDKTQALHNLKDAFNTGVTNKYKTDAMNQMYPQYAVDPSVGGKMHFTKGKNIKPEQTATFNSLVKEYMGPPYYMEGEAAIKAAKIASGYSNDLNESVPNMYGKKGGTMNAAYVMGSNVFPFMFY
jgi:hypothetical protein